MAPPTREATEAGRPAQESSVQQPSIQPKAAAGSVRPDAVSLEVPIKIHGSRAAAVLRDNISQTEPFEEQTTTIIVFPQGGVLRVTTGVTVGQMLVLTNLKSRQDAICRVVKVRSFAHMPSYVEVEFTQPQAKYWGVYFPSEAAAIKRELSTPAPQPGAKQTSPENRIPSLAAQKVPGPRPVKASPYSPETSLAGPSSAPSPPKPASPFVSIGAQEEVQPAAALTSEAMAPRPLTGEKQAYPPEPKKIDVARGLSLAPATELRDSTSDLEPLAASVTNDDQPKPATRGADASSHDELVFGSFEGEALFREDGAKSFESFRALLNAGIGRTGAGAARTQQNWLLIAASIAVLVGAVVGGVWYFRSKPAVSTENPPVSRAAPPTVSATTQPPASVEPLAPALPSNSSAGPDETDITSTPHATPSPGTSASGSFHPDARRSDGSTPIEPKPVANNVESARPTPPNMFASKMKAHPLSSARSPDLPNQAPAVDAVPASGSVPGELPGVGSSTVALPPPPGAGPVATASVGVAKEPKLISSVMPVYPSVAKQARVQGDVVIETEIDKNGNVARMNVVSGPSMLRQAALDALRRWKYQPQELDGKPVECELLVKIKFRL